MSGIGRRGSVCRCQRYAPRSYSKSGLTHTETHTGKRADKNNGEDRAYLPQYTERKASKSLKKQQAECPDTLRNQQVRCSSHPTSSKKHRKLRFSVLFCCKNAENGVSQNAGQLLTHTVTYTRKCADRFKEYRRGGFAPSPIFLMFFFCSHHLCHETAHLLSSTLLHLPRSVCVGA